MEKRVTIDAFSVVLVTVTMANPFCQYPPVLSPRTTLKAFFYMSNFPAISEQQYIQESEFPQLKRTVSARELHKFLIVGRQFNGWIIGRVESYGFLENIDYIRRGVPNGTGYDYHVSIDMAKELAMVERNDKGREVRKYFIECENKLKTTEPITDPLLQLAHAVMTAQGIIQDQSQKLLIAEPKAAALDLISDSTDSRCIRDTAKELKIRPSRLTDYLLEHRWIYRQSRTDEKLGKAMAFQHRIDQGLIKHCSVALTIKGQTTLATSVEITGKGLAKLALIFSGDK